MAEPITPPAVDTGANKPEDVTAELAKAKEQIATLEKRVKDKDDFSGRLTNEVGELRKKVEGLEGKKEPVSEGLDEETSDIAKDLLADGMDKETAEFNAKVLVRANRKLKGREVMGDMLDLVDEALDDGKLDKKIFEETKNEILEEFKGRKLAPTARKNFKIFKDCYSTVVKRKAEELKGKGQEDSEAKRNAEIAKTGIPPSGGGQQPQADEDKKSRDAIKNAGATQGSAFF